MCICMVLKKNLIIIVFKINVLNFINVLIKKKVLKIYFVFNKIDILICGKIIN